jgi:predicted nucleic acid-binding protein
MVIVDRTVWIDYLRGTRNAGVLWLDRELQRQRLGLTDLILCEVLQEVRDKGAFDRVRQDLLKFQVFETGGIDLAVAAAENYRKLRERRRTVRRTIDCLIATFCIEGGHALLHRDRDFDVFEKWLGLRVIHA